MARASYPTLLALDRFATLLGISPPHFNGAVSAVADDNPFPVYGCGDVWMQHQWQSHERVSREEIAEAIMNAEEDIANVLGFWPAPMFIEEVHQFPQHHRPDVFDSGLDVRGMRKSVNLKYGKLIQQGRRNVDFIGEATVVWLDLVYSDPDLDGYDEIATITLPTDLTEACEIKTYFDGYDTPEWEIRPPRSIEIVGPNVVITFWSWQLIDPDLWEAFPTGTGPEPLNLLGAIYVDAVDVYREFADTTEPTARFYWEPEVRNIIPAFCTSCSGVGCPACSLTYQDGCLHVRNVDEGIGVPVPAEYDEDEEIWTEQAFTECRAPDQVKVWYYAGDLDRLYLQHTTPTSAVRRRCDPLSNYYAEAIAWMATARLDRNFCNCKQVTAKVTNLRMDLTETVPNGPSFLISDDDLSNPFGTRRGEIMAWRRLSKLVKRRAQVAVI